MSVRKVVCPECGEESMFGPDELVLYSRIQCEECGAILEVVDEDPLTLEVAESDLLSEDDELDEEDEDI
jgi:uncharacterized protein (DUF983 family)